MRRVVITGLGPVSPIGTGRDEYWNALAEGKNGIDFIASFDTTKFTTKIAGEVKDFDPEKLMDRKEARHTDRVLQFAAAASDLALADSGLDTENIDKNMFGVYIGSGTGGISTIESNFETLTAKGPNRVSPFCVPMMIANMPAGYVAIRHQAKGPNLAIITACASGIHSVGEAYNCIVRGDADIMLAGGSEAAVVPISVAGFASLKALCGRNDDPAHASRPFDAERNGFVIGEGAGILVLEEYEAAKKRGAHIYGEVKGYGLTCDAHHITAPSPDGEGAYRAMKMAMDKAGWKCGDVQLINAHGTSTSLNDKMETIAIKKLLGEEQAKKVFVQATKSMIGHTLGAAGTLGAIAAIMAIEKGIVHPTINYEVPDPDCDLNYVPNKAVEAKVDRVLVNAFGFGGHNGVLAIQSCKD